MDYPDAAPASEPGRDRDERGRPRSSRPRDGLGRPLARGASGVARQPEGLVRSPAATLRLAQSRLDAGAPFHAHEVFEDAWKAAEQAEERELWRGLAQLAVGLTHAARGNRRGAASLLDRAADTLSDVAGQRPHGVEVQALIGWSRAAARQAAEAPGAGPVGLLPPRLAEEVPDT
jgi:hypothetical protein